MGIKSLRSVAFTGMKKSAMLEKIYQLAFMMKKAKATGKYNRIASALKVS